MARKLSGRATTWVVACIVVVAAGAWAWAQSGGNGIISGCLSPSGFIRGVEEDGFCRSGDVALSWYTKGGADSAFVQISSPAGGDLAGTYPNPTLASGVLDWSRITNIPAGFADGVDDAGSAASVEPWHEVGAPGEPPFEAGWSNNGLAATAAFYKDPFGRVHLKGSVRANVLASPQVFILPEGYRPLAALRERIVASSNDQFPGAHVVITPLGHLFMLDVDTSDIVSLDGVSFRAEQ